ncbi:MAG: molybdopterin molybdotransferase MoeA [Candidatus Saccharimonadales bacterium]
MITVQEAEKIILGHSKSFGKENVPIDQSLGRVLAEDIIADRDFPPYNRSTMDGITIKYSDFIAGIRSFEVLAVQAAGQPPLKHIEPGQAVQIMTGAAVPDALDCVIPIEEVELANGLASVTAKKVNPEQFIHPKGSDEPAGAVLVAAGQVISPSILPIIASVGNLNPVVNRLPKIVIVSTGDELVSIDKKPSPYQVRRSNDRAIAASLASFGVEAERVHLPDDPVVMKTELKLFLSNYDAIIISGGVSKGSFDYVPTVMEELGVEMLFHGVQQRPGKPLWFGKHTGGTVVFALPGNPVSTFLCTYKYVLPLLRSGLGMKAPAPTNAVLSNDIQFDAKLNYFKQVKLRTDNEGHLMAYPISSNGSGDFIGLADADGFLELPFSRQPFKKGQTYSVVAIRSIM